MAKRKDEHIIEARYLINRIRRINEKLTGEYFLSKLMSEYEASSLSGEHNALVERLDEVLEIEKLQGEMKELTREELDHISEDLMETMEIMNRNKERMGGLYDTKTDHPESKRVARKGGRYLRLVK